MSKNTISNQTIKAGYLIWRRSFGEELSNEYYRYCKSNRIPFVRIITDGGHRPRFVEVEMDMLTTAFAQVYHSLADDGEYLLEIESLFKQYGNFKQTQKDIERHGFMMYSIGDWPACFRIPRENAETVARGLFEIGKRWADKYQHLAQAAQDTLTLDTRR